MPQLSAWIVCGLFVATPLVAQFGIDAVADRDLGRPPRAPTLTFLGMMSPGRLVTDPSLPPVGPVASTSYEELRAQPTPAGPAGEVVNSIVSTYDGAGRLVEMIRKELGRESVTTNRYESSRLVSQETTFPNRPQPSPKFWNYWVYDAAGKLIDCRRGAGDKNQNHWTNFKRDSQGRLLSFEYRQGAMDELLSRTVFRYSADAKSIDILQYDAAGAVTSSAIQSADDGGRVIALATRDRDWRTKQLGPAVKIRFRYDDKGRLIEQESDPRKVEPSEHEVPPGKISIAYDDVNRTKTTLYSGDKGPLLSIVSYDANGATVGFSFGLAFGARVECTNDNRGNWTACRQIGTTGSVETVTKIWRRQITYR